MKSSVVQTAGIFLTLALGSVGLVSAAPVTYFGSNPAANGTVVGVPLTQRNLFTGSLATSLTEPFNMTRGVLATPTASLQNLFGLGTAASISANGAASTESYVETNPGAGNNWTGRFNTTGDPQLFPPPNPASTSGWFETNMSTVEFNFSTAVSAFGTFLTDVGDFDGALKVEVFNGAVRLLNNDLISAGNRTSQGGLAFFGYTNDTTPFTKIVFTLAQPAGVPVGQFDFVGFDDLITGTLKTSGGGGTPPGAGQIPEPTSLALVGLSLSLLGFSRRRKTKN